MTAITIEESHPTAQLSSAIYTPENISVKRAAMLQLLPGIASLPVFAVLAYFMETKSIPNMFALGITILLVEVPVTWGLMVWHLRRETGAPFSFATAFPWRQSMRWWHYLLLGLPIIFYSMMMIAMIGPKIASPLMGSLFIWIPDWFVMQPDPSMFTALSKEMLLALWALVGVSMVLVGGITQELFSRGFLLPRTQHMGNWAPAYNALLFSVFHLIAPWNWAGFFLMTLPWAYLVWWRRSIRIGLFVHIGMLTIQWIGLTLMVFGMVPKPS